MLAQLKAQFPKLDEKSQLVIPMKTHLMKRYPIMISLGGWYHRSTDFHIGRFLAWRPPCHVDPTSWIRTTSQVVNSNTTQPANFSLRQKRQCVRGLRDVFNLVQPFLADGSCYIREPYHSFNIYCDNWPIAEAVLKLVQLYEKKSGLRWIDQIKVCELPIASSEIILKQSRFKNMTHKVMLNSGNKIAEDQCIELGKMLTSYRDQIMVSDGLLRKLSYGRTNLNGSFFYVSNPDLLTFLCLAGGNFIKEIYTVKYVGS